MIDELHVGNLALIADATIEPAAGITVLTGETGAGKSALLSAVKLLVGERASGDQVRDGAEGLVVEGRFLLRGDRSEYPDGHVAVRRVSREGRSRCTLDGSMATVAQLAQVVGSTVDLCGQHDHQRLLNPATHLDFLDAWGGAAVERACEAYRSAWDARCAAAAELDRVVAAGNESATRIEDARFAIARIEDVAPEEGEYERLEALLPKLAHGETLLEAANGAYDLMQGDNGALDALNGALDALGRAERYDGSLGDIAGVVRDAVFSVEDAVSRVRRYRDDLDFDPFALERAQERMGALTGLVRLFGPRMEDVFARLAEARELVGLVDDAAEARLRAQRSLDAAEASLAQAAQALSQARRLAAPRFAHEVCEQMRYLEMGGAELSVDVRPLPRAQWGSRGADRVEFLYRPGKGMTARPFAKIASGGEVSRVMLSIKVVLGAHARDDAETLVFDEIDAGVGGSTACRIAAVLQSLAQTHQVIVVTHLAQIAVAADRQYVVRKTIDRDGGRPQTELVLVEGEDRVREVARMLSGETSERALEHARELLGAARS